ncbi:MATE family efflux transporter [Candidatus Dependentiae bacterium]|nr:MATE family efflux transporter [Candidatus Dependentiae bacterium]
MKRNFTLASIYSLAWLALASQITVMSISFIDLLFIGQLGGAAVIIAAAAIANNICAAVYAFLEGIRTGTTVLVARFFGAKQPQSVTKTINLALLLAIVIGCLILPVIPIISSLTFKTINNGELVSTGVPYLTIRLMGLPFHLIIFAVIGLFRGLKNAVFPFLITMTICLSDVLLNYVFMYGKWGFPALGIKGIALATLITYIIGSILSILLLITIPLTKKYLNLKNILKFDRPIFKTFMKVGGEVGLYAGSLIFALLLFVLLFTKQGPNVMAAHQIVFQVFLATYLPPTGFFVAATILIGKAIGEKQYDFVIPATKKIFFASLPFVGGISLAVSLFAKQIAQFFSPANSVVVTLAVPSIYLICITQLFSSSYLILKGTLTAARDTRFVFIAGTLSSYLFFLPLAYLLGIKMGYGIFGGYVSFLLWTVLDSIVFGWRLFVTKPINSSS